MGMHYYQTKLYNVYMYTNVVCSFLMPANGESAITLTVSVGRKFIKICKHWKRGTYSFYTFYKCHVKHVITLFTIIESHYRKHTYLKQSNQTDRQTDRHVRLFQTQV